MSLTAWLVVVFNFVVRNDIFFQRIAAPVGRNVEWCCDTLSLYNIVSINRDWYCVVCSLHSSLPDCVVTSVGVVYELNRK